MKTTIVSKELFPSAELTSGTAAPQGKAFK